MGKEYIQSMACNICYEQSQATSNFQLFIQAWHQWVLKEEVEFLTELAHGALGRI